MRALGGLASPREVTVRIENRGTPQQVEQASLSFDPEGFIIDVVTADIGRGGRTASAIEAIATGSGL